MRFSKGLSFIISCKVLKGVLSIKFLERGLRIRYIKLLVLISTQGVPIYYFK
ncbi:hypothetical protein PZA11_006611 [Diplocarpon coronariae]